jgi:hypothetical protein
MSETRFLIRKNGYFYRPDSAGYTTSKADAGRYTLEEAHKITHPNGQNGPRDGMSYVAEHLWPQGPTPQITLSAAMELPEVRALVEAATTLTDDFRSYKFNSMGDFYDPGKDRQFASILTALDPFTEAKK